jgi:hypothetical protein
MLGVRAEAASEHMWGKKSESRVLIKRLEFDSIPTDESKKMNDIYSSDE